MESVEARDYFTYRPRPSTAHDDPSSSKTAKLSVNFHSPGTDGRPHPMSRMSTHRLDTSSTNFAEVLHDDGGPNGLRNLDIDYFNTVLDVFRDQKQHHSPVVFDFMLLHEINIHHLEHLLIAEWDWLSIALSHDDEKEAERKQRAQQAPRRLTEIQSLLHKYSVALRDFEDMRKRATLDEALNPLSHSSWHEKLLQLEERTHIKPRHPPANPFRRLSHVIQQANLSKDDPEKFHKPEIPLQGEDAKPNADNVSKKKKLFGSASPACRQLAGVEDWQREYSYRELNVQQKKKALRDEWLATRFRRISLAVFAGIAFILPMLLMTLVGTLKCSLTTTSLATLLCPILCTLFTNISERDIIAITAGYAAVLVVFVGTQH